MLNTKIIYGITIFSINHGLLITKKANLLVSLINFCSLINFYTNKSTLLLIKLVNLFPVNKF